MNTPNIAPIQIPPAGTIEELRRSVTNAINKLIAAINAQTINGNLDVAGNRIINVGDPASLTDAVTKRWVQGELDKIGTTNARVSNKLK